MKIRVTDSKRFDPHCAFCKDEFALDDRDVDACPECETHLHEDCWQEVKSCPTVGCAWHPTREEPASRPATSRPSLERVPRRPRIRCYRCSELLGGSSETCTGCGWSFHAECFGERSCCPKSGNLTYPHCARCGGRLITRSRHTCRRCEAVLHTSCSAHHRCKEDASSVAPPDQTPRGGIAFLVALLILIVLSGVVGYLVR